MIDLAAPPRASTAERVLIPATFLTCLGNNIQLIAAALLVVHAEDTTLAVGWLFIAVAIPPALLSALFGRLADRVDRRMLCLVCDAASALAAVALPVWLLLGGPVGTAVYLTNLLLAIVNALFLPACNALIKERVHPTRLSRFNADFEMANSAGMLLSAAIGGVVVALVGPEPLFFFNALTFLASALCWLFIGRRPPAPVTLADDVVVTAAASVVRSPLMRLGLLYVVGNVVIVVSNTLIVVLVVRVFHQGPGVLGLVDALAGVGMLLAAAVYRSSRVPDLRVALIGFVGVAVVIALQPNIGLLGLALFLPGGFTFGLARLASRTLLMTAVPEDRAGRIFGAANGIGLAASVATTLAVSLIADHTEVRYGFLFLTVLILAVAVPTLASLNRIVGGRR